MKTMTRPAAGAHRPAALRTLPAAGRTPAVNRPGRSFQVFRSAWAVAAVAAATVAVLQAALVPWLLLPVAPALLLQAAGGGIEPVRRRRVMWPFSVATLAAVLCHLLGTDASLLTTGACVTAAAAFVGAVERLATAGGSASGPLGRPAA